MLCQNCHTNDAGVHLRRIVNGEAAEVHLCAECAKALGYGNVFSGFAFPLSRLSDTGFSSIGNRVLRCDVCSLSFDDIARASRTGCPNCYRVFYDKLLPSVQKIHGRVLYGGDPAPQCEALPDPKGEPWYADGQNRSRIVLGSSALLSANVDGLPFPARLSPMETKALGKKIYACFGGEGYTLTEPSGLYPYELASLAERGVITPEFSAARDGALLAASESGNFSAMLGDEDHMKLRVWTCGLAPEKAYRQARAYRDAVNKKLPLALSRNLGFLNQSPSDLGTGLRASVVMHLPVLAKTGAVPALSSVVSKLGLSVSGVLGAGLTASGDLFRVSNVLTMGLSEAEAISNLKAFCLQLETRERAAAELFVQDIAVKDRVNRAVAVLSSAVLLTSAEMNELLSWIRLGTVYGLCDFDLTVIGRLFFTMQPAGVNALTGEKLPAAKRDEVRAKLLRQALFEK